jgi:hypothetical protein
VSPARTGERRGVRRAAMSRTHLVPAARVALAATLLMALVYAGIVTLLDVIVNDHLVGQVDRQLSARLAAGEAAAHDGSQPSAGGRPVTRYGLGIYGEPIYVWVLSANGSVVARTSGAPRLVAAAFPSTGRAATVSGGSTSYRLDAARYGRGRRVARAANADQRHRGGAAARSRS